MSGFTSFRGGKSEALHSKKGQIEKQSASDQLAEDKSVKALLNTFKTGQPVVLLIDDRYSLFPFDLAAGKYTYVVLGFYKIVHAWGKSICLKVSFTLIFSTQLICNFSRLDSEWCATSSHSSGVTNREFRGGARRAPLMVNPRAFCYLASTD